MKKQSLFIMIIMLFTVLLIGGFFNYVKEEPKNEKKKELIIYKNTNGLPHDPYLFCCDTNEVYTKILTETGNAKVLNVSEKGNYILIEDKYLKILNTKTNELQTLDLEPNYKRYFLQTIENEKLLGITFYNKEDYNNINASGYYNLETKEIIYKDKYSFIKAENEYYLTAYKENEKQFILSSQEEKVIWEEDIDYKENNIKTKILTYKDKILISKYFNEQKTYNLYDIKNNLLIENISQISVNEDKIYTVKNDAITIYDFDLNIISKQTIENAKIEFLTKQYLVFTKDDIIFMMDLNALSTTKIYDLKNTYTLANTYQGYKQSGLHKENNNKEGIYIYLTKKDNIEENKFDTLDLEILISNDLKVNIFELDGSRMSELENGGLMS